MGEMNSYHSLLMRPPVQARLLEPELLEKEKGGQREADGDTEEGVWSQALALDSNTVGSTKIQALGKCR